jgi:hypothetical protein
MEESMLRNQHMVKLYYDSAVAWNGSAGYKRYILDTD